MVDIPEMIDTPNESPFKELQELLEMREQAAKALANPGNHGFL